jgi:hypothetical protein
MSPSCLILLSVVERCVNPAEHFNDTHPDKLRVEYGARQQDGDLLMLMSVAYR